MNLWRRWSRRKSRFEQEMSEELRFHIEQQTAANIAAGVPPKEGRRQAMLQLGAVEGVKEDCREYRRGFWLETVWLDIRHGARVLRRILVSRSLPSLRFLSASERIPQFSAWSTPCCSARSLIKMQSASSGPPNVFPLIAIPQWF